MSLPPLSPTDHLSLWLIQRSSPLWTTTIFETRTMGVSRNWAMFPFVVSRGICGRKGIPLTSIRTELGRGLASCIPIFCFSQSCILGYLSEVDQPPIISKISLPTSKGTKYILHITTIHATLSLLLPTLTFTSLKPRSFLSTTFTSL
jgi:hypothetical protein